MKTFRTISALMLIAGVLLIPAQAQANTITVAPGCEVYYDSGHVYVDPASGEVDFESPSASASTRGCYAIYMPCCLEDLLPTICCIDDWIGVNWGILEDTNEP